MPDETERNGPADENVNQSARPPAKCLECGGSGRVVLLTSSRPCPRCRGETREERPVETVAEDPTAPQPPSYNP